MTLTERIDQAIDRIIAGHSPQRIPADLTDPDIVLTDCKARIAELEAELRKRPWVDGEDIVQGEHEADTGTIGYTHAGVDRLLTKARTEKQWVITRITEELKREGIQLEES